PDQVIDISPQLEETALNEIDQLIGSLDEPINNSIPILEEELNEQNLLVKIKEDLMQPLEPQKASRISPFKRTTWKEKLNDILEKLPTHVKSRENQIKTLEAYYYLRTLIQENEANQKQIKKWIQETNGAYKAQNIWKGA
ncbi:22568_t:CDS:1, partial [Cetraspora pellucida]